MTPLLLDQLTGKLEADFALHPVVASEIEFYLIGADNQDVVSAFWNDVLSACSAQNIAIFNHGKEEGAEQFEISLKASPDVAKIARDTTTLKAIISHVAGTHLLRGEFAARPFANRPGSGLHIHVHLADNNHKNVYFKNDQQISDALKYSIGGLLEWLPDCMAIFAPEKDSYLRFADKNNAPTTVSWGANNRTVAIRLPQAAHENKHIEHRVAGSDADPLSVIAAILAAIHYGLKNHCEPGAQIYGDASLPMYNLPRLPATLDEALALQKKSVKLQDYALA